MKSSKKRSRAVVTVILCLLAVCLAAGLLLFQRVNRKIQALQAGADFTLSYTVTAQDSTNSPALYSILKQLGATTGDVAGLYAPGQLQLYLYPAGGVSAPESGGTNFFTDIYIDADQTLFNAGQLYRTLRDSAAASVPLVGSFLPEWSLPNYISQAQLASILGVPNVQIAMQDLSGYTLTISRQNIVHPEDAKEGYTYYQFPTDSTDSPTVVLGLPVKALLKEEAIPVDLRVSIPAHGVHVALSGTVEPAVNSFSAPADRIQDSDIESIVRLRQALEQIAGLVGSAIKAAQ